MTVPEPPPAGESGPRGDEAASRLHRRGFFTQGFKNLLRPLADFVEKRIERVDVPEWWTEDERQTRYDSASRYPAGPGPEGAERELLRPPGALPETEFLARCTSCAECVTVCPVAAIKLVSSSDPRQDRKPAIDPGIQACVLCDDLSCMRVCPTGALQKLSREAIRMGVAVLRADVCVRTRGEDCQICVDKCPIGVAALDISSPGGPVVVKAACVGCGVCEMYCPTQPKAIVVEPLE
jgi:ferredoxin-type protein NapG